jgi:hypothetical protein
MTTMAVKSDPVVIYLSEDDDDDQEDDDNDDIDEDDNFKADLLELDEYKKQDNNDTGTIQGDDDPKINTNTSDPRNYRNDINLDDIDHTNRPCRSRPIISLRTKQTARKSMGGQVPCKQRAVKAVVWIVSAHTGSGCVMGNINNVRHPHDNHGCECTDENRTKNASIVDLTIDGSNEDDPNSKDKCSDITGTKQGNTPGFIFGLETKME